MAGLPVTEDELRDIFVSELEMVDAEGFRQARNTARRLRIPLERAVVDKARVPYSFLLEQLACTWGVTFVDLKVSDVQRTALKLVPEEFCRSHALVPFEHGNGEIHVAMEDPRDRRSIGDIERRTSLRVRPYLAPEAAIQRAHLLYRADLFDLLQRQITDDAPSRALAEDMSMPELVNRLLEFAVVSRASDIHIEPFEIEVVVRYRIDGALQDVLSLPANITGPLVSRIKVLSGMRLDEKRVPQDGRISAEVGGITMDLRVSSLPTLFGEKVVLRVLSNDTANIDLQHLGLTPTDYDAVLRHVLRPFGMVLVTGPTGSGKSTSLYALLMRISADRRSVVNISTVEDPVEYTIPRVTQTSVNATGGMDFPNGLRALLRQDPDVIMVGEIRDAETAHIAVRSALVGRMLLSTLHTNDSTTAVARLIDMGVEPFLLASTLSLVVAQRLVRRVCTACRETVPLDDATRAMLERRHNWDQTVASLRARGVIAGTGAPLDNVSLFRGRGCPQCNGTGFRGRLGVFEVFEVNEPIRQLIMRRPEADVIRAAAVQAGMSTLFADGVGKAILGETTIEEVLRAAV